MDNTMIMYIDYNDIDPYKYISGNEKYYSSSLSFRSHQNYFRHKNESYKEHDLLQGLVTDTAENAFNAIRQKFGLTFNKTIEKLINEAVKQAVKENPNMTWTD